MIGRSVSSEILPPFTTAWGNRSEVAALMHCPHLSTTPCLRYNYPLFETCSPSHIPAPRVSSTWPCYKWPLPGFPFYFPMLCLVEKTLDYFGIFKKFLKCHWVRLKISKFLKFSTLCGLLLDWGLKIYWVRLNLTIWMQIEAVKGKNGCTFHLSWYLEIGWAQLNQIA